MRDAGSKQDENNRGRRGQRRQVPLADVAPGELWGFSWVLHEQLRRGVDFACLGHHCCSLPRNVNLKKKIIDFCIIKYKSVLNLARSIGQTPIPVKKITVFVGAHDMSRSDPSDSRFRVEAVSWEQHEGWNPSSSMRHDLGLVRIPDVSAKGFYLQILCFKMAI